MIKKIKFTKLVNWFINSTKIVHDTGGQCSACCIHCSWDYVILDPNSLNWFTLGFRLVEIGLFCDQIIGLGYFEIKICKDWILL